MEEAVPHLGVGASHPPAIADDDDNPPFVGVDHLFELAVVTVERFPVLAHGFLCRVKSQDFDEIRPELRVVELIVRVEQLPRYLQAGAHPLVDPANRLDVLLRHRPPSIARQTTGRLLREADGCQSLCRLPVVVDRADLSLAEREDLTCSVRGGSPPLASPAPTTFMTSHDADRRLRAGPPALLGRRGSRSQSWNQRRSATRPLCSGPIRSTKPPISRHSTSSVQPATKASRSRSSNALKDRRTTSTFSCDIAYSDRPTASNASRGSEYASHRDTLAVPPGQHVSAAAVERHSAPPARAVARMTTTA